ncbi:MAG: copper chaperone PCu(A)C [Candidatus Paracaedibacteraceae bacterium]|nr:copper chaperone PCu(A)C [Candidatus Paracaedibacteraceae bacterium]
MRKIIAILVLSLTAAFSCTKTVGTFEISKPTFRALKGAANGSAYFTITQMDDASDKLLSASCNVACERIELHDHITDPVTNVKKMTEIKDIIIPGKKDDSKFKSVEFVIGGKHLMLMGLKPGVTELKEVDIKLVFKKAGEIVVKFKAEDKDSNPHTECSHGCKH